MEVFVDVWEAQVEELGKVLRLITAGGDPSKSKFARQCTLIGFFLVNYKNSFRVCFWTDDIVLSPLTSNIYNISDSHSFRKLYLKESMCIVMLLLTLCKKNPDIKQYVSTDFA